MKREVLETWRSLEDSIEVVFTEMRAVHIKVRKLLKNWKILTEIMFQGTIRNVQALNCKSQRAQNFEELMII
jgi:hypothetical protein